MKHFMLLTLYTALFCVACQSPVVPEEEKPVTFRKVPITGIEYQGGGYVDGTLQAARFSSIADMAFDEKGNFYVADAGNNVIRYVDLENDQVSTFAGEKYAVTEEMPASETYRNGSLKEARFSAPVSLAMTSDGALYVADSRNHKVRKIYKGQVTTLLGDSSGNISPGESPKTDYSAEPDRKSGSLEIATVIFPYLLRAYKDQYLFLYEASSTSRFIDLEKNIILSAPDTFASTQEEKNLTAPHISKNREFGDVLEALFDQRGGVWIAAISPTYALTYYSVAGERKVILGENQTNSVEGFTGYRSSGGQKDGGFDDFGFRSPVDVMMGTNPDYLFVEDQAVPTVLRLVDLKRESVSTVSGVEDFGQIFISPDNEMYMVRGRAIYRIEPSPVKVLTSGEAQ